VTEVVKIYLQLMHCFAVLQLTHKGIMVNILSTCLRVYIMLIHHNMDNQCEGLKTYHHVDLWACSLYWRNFCCKM